MIQDSYDMHPANYIFESNCYQTDNEITYTSKLENSDINKKEKIEFSLSDIKSSQKSIKQIKHKEGLMNNEESKNFYAINNETLEKSTGALPKTLKKISENDKYLQKVNKFDLIKEGMLNIQFTFYSYELNSNNKFIDMAPLIKKTGNLPMQIKQKRFERWGRKEDINLFIHLRKELAANGIKEHNFLYIQIKNAINHNTQSIQTPIYSWIIDKLSHNTNWSRTPFRLLHRIQRLCSNQQFSVREIALLKRLLSKKKNGNRPNASSIIKFFPGKSIQTIKDKVENLFVNG